MILQTLRKRLLRPTANSGVSKYGWFSHRSSSCWFLWQCQGRWGQGRQSRSAFKVGVQGRQSTSMFKVSIQGRHSMSLFNVSYTRSSFKVIIQGQHSRSHSISVVKVSSQGQYEYAKSLFKVSIQGQHSWSVVKVSIQGHEVNTRMQRFSHQSSTL